MPRYLNLLLAAVLICLSLPLMLAVALALLCERTWPVLYVGTRIGRGMRPFRILKFRTIQTPADEPDCAAGGHLNDRITPLGRFLRRSRLDELPQLFNVLIGDLDLVGYRPPLPEYVAQHPDLYRPLMQNRPGITGLASVLFYKREDRLLANVDCPDEAAAIHSRICIPAKARLDLFYQRNRSTQLDFRILGMTARKMCVPGFHGTPTLALPPARRFANRS